MADYQKRYNPHRHADWNYGGTKWKLSRSKIELFLECPRCFYLDNKLGTKRPSFPSFTLNIAVDELCKKEFDQYRESQTSHPIMDSYDVDAVPFSHPQLDQWRDNFTGITYAHKPTGLVVSGAVDDIWVTSEGSLIVVDYKATSKEGTITTLADSSWEESYRRQLGVYQWLLVQNGYSVSPTGYFLYANATQDKDGFYDTLSFHTTLVPCEGETSWIEPTLHSILDTLESESYPSHNPSCEYCAYRTACGQKLQQIYAQQHKK